ncbi:uncharacterized protein LOC119090692 [Pollicipes pollicipes]|uniref:uncharacterized protein LOC119090692 n=1 Tax=Pollicipes pollicipes TaxID=41117 RepID=UPI001885A046|nr:uncharacterized protein LOC119090692 [Pollicipes pollicipes]
MPMAVVDTVVTCQSRNMRVEFSLSAPFHGIIYPYNHFHNCLLHEGNGESRVTLLLGHGTCANENGLGQDGSLSPVIEHRLMIQWDREIVEEWDSSIIVRCDRPDDYNKTIRFDLSTLDKAASFISSTHPGPQMWMEIQKGEGPNAPELQGSVFLGQVLTLVFTLADEYFEFDTNVLTCWALDGEERRQIEWLNPAAGSGGGGGGGSQLAQRRYTGEMEVIHQGCSAKPKIFGHFYKTGGNFNDQRSVTQYAFFKAFRFPTSARVVIQCNVQVCFRKCQELRPCSESFNPRSALGADEPGRQRREAGEPADERVNLVRSIEVRLPEEAADLPGGAVPHGATSRVRYVPADGMRCPQCASLTTFFIVLVALAALLALLIGAVLWVYVRRQHGTGSLSTPTK